MSTPEHSRPRTLRARPSAPNLSRTATTSSVPYISQAESLILPEGALGDEATELLQEFVHPHHHGAEATLVGSETPSENGSNDLDKKSKAPWWKKPSPWWILGVMPFTAIATSATLAPRIEIYTMLACSVHKPDVFKKNFPDVEWDLQGLSLGAAGLDSSSSVFSVTPTVYVPSLSVPMALSIFASSQDNGTVTPPRRNLCASDPVVQAAVAKLTAVIATSMGVLSCITTGWWGAFSDRYGRTRVMGISILALLVTDFNFIMVALFSRHMPGGYWFLVVGPVLEGLLGGMSTGIAAVHGYLADTSTESNRSRIFSLSLGLLFTGMALGPTLGSLLILFTGQTLSVFFVAFGTHIAYSILAWAVLPESLSKDKMQKARIKYAADLLDAANEREQNPTVGFLIRLRRLFAFLSPLTVFYPEEEKSNGNPLKRPKKNYNLTLVAIAFGLNISLMGSYSYKFQYAASNFGWTAETLGYYLSIVGAARAFYLTILLPIAIKLFKPKPIVLQIPAKPRDTTPLLQSADPGQQSLSISRAQVPKTITKEIHSPAFDLALGRFSLLVEVVGYTCMGISPTAMMFTVFGMVGSLGAGFSPATQSVMLALYARRGGTEIGRLFGALSVVQALSSQIIGPAVYGLVYMKTVATYPRTIFWVTVATVTTSFILINFVRLPQESDYRRESLADLEERSPTSDQHAHVQEDTLVDAQSQNRAHTAETNSTLEHRPVSYGSTAN